MHVDEYAALVAGQMTEQTFQTQVLALSRQLGWRSYHTAISYGSQAGFPDLVLVRENRLVFAELKRQSPKSQPTAKQQQWLDDLAKVATWSSGAVEVYLWRPIDITTGTIAEVLR